MCIDRLSHIVNGRKPMQSSQGEATYYTKLHTCETWLDVWNWLTSVIPEHFNAAEETRLLKQHGNYTRAEILSAAAKCHIVDFRNDYEYIENDGHIVIFAGE